MKPTWDSPDATPIADVEAWSDTFYKQMGVRPDVVQMSQRMYDRLAFEFTKTKIRHDWDRHLFPRLTRLLRWYRRVSMEARWAYDRRFHPERTW